MPIASTIRTASIGTDPNAAAQPDGVALAEIFGEIISGLAEGSGEGASQAAVTADVVAATPTPTVGEGEVAKTVEQLLALASSDLVGAAKIETSTEVEDIANAAEDSASPKEILVPQNIAAALATIEQRPQYRPIKLATEVATPIASLDRSDPETMPISDLPQIANASPVLAQPGVGAQKALADVPQPAPAGVRSDFAASQVIKDVPQGIAPAAQIAAPEGRRVDEAVSISISKEAPTPAPHMASPRTEAVVQLALSGLEAAVKAMPAQISGSRSASPSKRGGDVEQSISLPELKLSTAMALPSIQPIAAAFDAPRPLEVASIGTPAIPQPLDASELVIERQLDMAHEGEWLDQLARDISRTSGSEGSPLRFRLNPENLGSLRVEINQDRNGAAVRLTTDTEAARTIIAEAQPRLIAEARAHGIRISEAHVDLGGQTASGDPRRQNAVFEEAPLRTARSLQEHGEGDGNPTPGRSERYA
jgi:flagellar hook-length control protein FliK